MRLIDGDALAEELLYDAELCAKALDSHEITDHKELAKLQFEKDCKQNCVYYISESPTVDAVPVFHAHWVSLEPVIGLYECSSCGHKILRAKCNYCPNCGSKMDGERKGGDE